MNKHLKILDRSQQHSKQETSKCSFTAGFCGFWISMGSTSHPSIPLHYCWIRSLHEAATFLFSQILTFKSSQISITTSFISQKKGLIGKTQYGCELGRGITKKSLHCSYFPHFGAGDSFSVDWNQFLHQDFHVNLIVPVHSSVPAS